MLGRKHEGASYLTELEKAFEKYYQPMWDYFKKEKENFLKEKMEVERQKEKAKQEVDEYRESINKELVRDMEGYIGELLEKRKKYIIEAIARELITKR